MDDTNHLNDHDWRSLCEMAAKENDPQKLLDLVMRINQALEKRRARKEDKDKEVPDQTDVAPVASGRRDHHRFSFPAPLASDYDC